MQYCLKKEKSKEHSTHQKTYKKRRVQYKTAAALATNNANEKDVENTTFFIQHTYMVILWKHMTQTDIKNQDKFVFLFALKW